MRLSQTYNQKDQPTTVTSLNDPLTCWVIVPFWFCSSSRQRFQGKLCPDYALFVSQLFERTKNDQPQMQDMEEEGGLW